MAWKYLGLRQLMFAFHFYWGPIYFNLFFCLVVVLGVIILTQPIIPPVDESLSLKAKKKKKYVAIIIKIQFYLLSNIEMCWPK